MRYAWRRRVVCGAKNRHTRQSTRVNSELKTRLCFQKASDIWTFIDPLDRNSTLLQCLCPFSGSQFLPTAIVMIPCHGVFSETTDI